LASSDIHLVCGYGPGCFLALLIIREFNGAALRGSSQCASHHERSVYRAY
jgi:hypothetical protein